MLKLNKLIPMVALLAVTGTGIQAQQMPGPEGMHKRFEQMDRKMEDARKSHGTERQQYVHEHMQMMHDQMQAMHGMMSGGKPGMGMGMGLGSGGRMGSGPHGTGGRIAQGGEQRMQHMQNRMDLMQGVMEQMQKQHELMLNDGASKKN